MSSPTPITSTPSTTTAITTTEKTAIAIECGLNRTCNESEECFAASDGPKCSDNGTTSNWKLDPMVFPPIHYIGKTIGKSENDSCDLFRYSLWSEDDLNWLLTFFYQNWDDDDNNNNITLPSGSFVRPLDYIGSCSDISRRKQIYLQQLYCDDDNLCKKKINPSVENTRNCTSSNQCLTQLCGDMTATRSSDGNKTFTETCRDDDFLAYGELKGNRFLNVVQEEKDDNNGGKKGRNKNSESMGRTIDPETGEIITLSGRVRRGASLLLSRGGSLNRENSVRTLPPYTVVDEDHASTSDNGIATSDNQLFFPPGELPPPYDSVSRNENDNTRNGFTLDEVREGVTIENHNNSESPLNPHPLADNPT